MIDIHCHMLPGLDDGATTVDVALDMARMAVADGIVTTVCTPHITPGVYNNTGASIHEAAERFREALDRANIPLTIAVGADAHIDPSLVVDLRSGRVPTVGSTRYFLLEPPHHAAPPRLDAFCFGALTAGYVPILTHPERLSWVEAQFELIRRLANAGVIMQVTGGSILGGFGRRAQFWAEKLLDEGLVDVIASDGHNCALRPPVLSRARTRVAETHGEVVSERLCASNPLAILQNVIPSKLRQPLGWTEERPT